jgi:hypothetical protein
MGASWHGYYDVAGRNRDSDILTNSNWDCWVKFLTELLGPADTVIGTEDEPVSRSTFGTEEGDDIYNWTICREGHWACGWIEIIRVHESVGPDKLAAIDAKLQELDGYPVFDGQHYSAAEEAEHLRCWTQAGAREDFIHAIKKAFREDNTVGDSGLPEDEERWAELQTMLTKLDDVSTDALIEMHEWLIPSGEYHHDGWPCIDLSVGAMTWDDLVDLTSEK